MNNKKIELTTPEMVMMRLGQRLDCIRSIVNRGNSIQDSAAYRQAAETLDYEMCVNLNDAARVVRI